MKQNTLDLSTILGSLFVLVMVAFLGQQARADEGKIICETAYGEKHLIIGHDEVAFSRGAPARSISSVSAVRTEKRFHGFKKIMNLEGNKHTIFIKDVENFSEVEDSLSVTSPKGHEMTYPLTCHKA